MILLGSKKSRRAYENKIEMQESAIMGKQGF